ncbi:MAG: hypothetical protein FJX47_10360 [Alphaproteobacteria bacterium]|nr:hypothetical protein [Alphaproteobacteria bacterium]
MSNAGAAAKLQDFPTSVIAERQEICCVQAGIDPTAWKGQADPALIGNECYRAITKSGRSIDGYVHVESRFRFAEPVPCDKLFVVKGRIEGTEDTPKGPQLRLIFDLHWPGQDKPFGIVDIVGLQATAGALRQGDQPAPPPAPAGAKPAAPAPEADPTFGFKPQGKFQLTPQKVDRYSRYVGNQVHFDPRFAQSLGLRAPIAQGFMQSTIVFGLVAQGGPIKKLDATVKFRRPLFWDQEVSLWGRERAPGQWISFRALNPERKITSETSIAVLVR